MKKKPFLLIIIVVGFCLGVGLVQLAPPFCEYATGVWLRQKGFDEASLDLGYPEPGHVSVRNLVLRKDGVSLRVREMRVQNPFYFVFGGASPSFEANGVALTVPELMKNMNSMDAVLTQIAAWADAWPFRRARVENAAVAVGKAVRLEGNCTLEGSPAFVCAAGVFSENGRTTLTLGAELTREEVSGFLWWKTPEDAPAPHWGGLAWNDGKLSSFLCEDADGRTVLREPQQAQAFEKFRHLIVTALSRDVVEKKP